MQPRLLRSPARLAGASLLRVQTDDRLVALARDGHERAFAAIVERYRPALERYATRLVGPSRGEDAVQQAFVNAHAALITNPDKTIELRPWLYRIVHNAALNTLRSSRDEQPLGEAAEQLSLDDDAIERRERLREALDALAALPANQRDAILLRELEGRSHDEIAVALGLTPGAARQQIFRARAALRAAATAITPQPLLVRTLELAGGGSGAADVAAGAGAGLTAVLTKAGAGVLVTGAVVGGAVGTGVVHTPRLHEQRPPAAREAAAHPKRSAEASSHGSASAGAAPDSAKHGSSEAARRPTSRHERSSDRKHTADRSGSDRRRRGTTAPTARPVTDHRGPSRTGSGVQEIHHGGSTNDVAGTEHSGHHGRHGGRGGGDTVAGATTQPESTEVETETPETETGGGGGGGASGGGGSSSPGGGGGGGGGTQTTTDAQPPATTTGGTVTAAPTNGGGGGAIGGATTVVPPDSSGSKGK